MPAYVPPAPQPLGLKPRKRMEDLQRSRTFLMRHAIIAAALALFFIGFNAAFTPGLAWFPWPVATLIVLWLCHLFKYTELVRSYNQGFNAWLDISKLNAADYLHLAGDAGARSRDPEREVAPEQIVLDFGEPAPRRNREWLE